jgi:hypothetical protein
LRGDVVNDDITPENESDIHRAAYESGDKAALLQMIQLCFVLEWPVPEWAAKAFVEACGYVEMGGSRSWDDVFGCPRPKKKHKRSAQLRNRKYDIYKRVQDLHEQEGMPIDGRLFERVGRETGLGGSTVIKELYYQVAHLLRLLKTSGN